MFKKLKSLTGIAEDIEEKRRKESLLQTTFSPECDTCGTRMNEITYDSRFHQELYWCSKCGTLNVEVNAKDTILVPEITKRTLHKKDPLLISCDKKKEVSCDKKKEDDG